MSENFNAEAVETICAKINTLYKEFLTDSEKVSNKAGARRARKTSLSLTTLMKEYRKISIK